MIRDLILLKQRVVVVDPELVSLNLQEDLLPDNLGRHVIPVGIKGKQAVLVHLPVELERGVVVGGSSPK